MDAINDKQKWRAQFRETMELLECMKARQLAAMTEAEGLRILKTLTLAAPPWRERPDWSGLVEQQAYFHRRKKS